ncbi:glycine-rich domain-containing protein [Streptomyces olivaceoviridis]
MVEDQATESGKWGRSVSRACADGQYFEINDDGELTMVPGSLVLRKILTYGQSGTFTFKKGDYPWLARVRVIVQGAGGGPAGANAASGKCVVRPGGAAGGYAESLIEASALGAAETIVVGAGGAAGTGNASGSAGGGSSFGGFAIANGGDGGTAFQNNATSLDAVSGVTGPVANRGQIASGGGAGGGAIRLSATQGLGGAGGDSRLGFGGLARATEGPGTTPRGWGGGAGGPVSYGAAENGADGGGGLVVIELYG